MVDTISNPDDKIATDLGSKTTTDTKLYTSSIYS